MFDLASPNPTHIIICYRQYGRWSATVPFPITDRKKAEAHADMYLRGTGNEHKELVTFLEVTLPE